MTDPVVLDAPAAEVVGALRAAVDGLLALVRDPARVAGIGDAGLVELLREVEVQTRRLPGVDVEVVAEIERRGIATALHLRDTRGLLVSLLRVGAGEAFARVRAAESLATRRTLSGQVLPALFPVLAAAVGGGEVSVTHARVITATVDALPVAVQAVQARAVEAALVETARTVGPEPLRVAARRVLDHLDPDGRLSEAADQHRRRELLLQQRADGSGTLHGYLTAPAFQRVRTVLDTLARPDPGTNGQKDPRTAPQRYHALDAAATRLLRAGTLPESGGVPLTVLVTMTREQFGTRTGLARTATGALLPAATVLDSTADAALIPIAIEPSGRVAAIGHTQRLATAAQRHALAARDKGCTHPGCTVPPTWCDTHHVTPWTLTARTHLDDLTLACGYHHGLIEHGWTIHMINHAPHWTPPPWIDPTRTPRRNHAHDPPTPLQA
jgi:hypothetical protein